MSKLLLGVIALLIVNGCATKEDKGYYNRAINASQKAQDRLDRE